ncbi:proline/glycine betaine ABC transporter ATP-binding protein [Aliidongia dinghuensis]|uniref:Quaternary amine transport ATP-binding protein n=1 Tax=Aliidongia dinghuensis TaxID=1867774 RepID=A0A8J2Z0K0_9PROT|nr:glycine betaine/L-proline ABC transporter ATP-binding protein [Aliidongia dinghuensis]GGF47112.1 proline/glycine betaine ABC transporter ATP-binding protein [Aliidongia dinghuensis]
MGAAYSGIGVPRMARNIQSDASIEIRELFKIFGASPARHVEAVRNGLSKTELGRNHGHVLALNNISIAMPAGKIQVIMGLSGSGKSTLIRHINRLVEPTSGSIVIDGRDILDMGELELREFRRNRTAMVFQKFALLPHRTVIENVTFGLEVRGMPKAKARDVGMAWIERVGLHGFDARYPHELSGGMQQRVGLARALSNDAAILLMDEAYSALDPLIRTDMQTVLLDLQAELKKTIVFITHDLDEALRLGDQIAILRDGEVVQQGTSQDIVLRPADNYVMDFVKGVNRARVVRVETVMKPLGRAYPTGDTTIPAGAAIEDAMRMVVHGPDTEVVVVGSTGQPVGLVSLRELAGALISPGGSLPQNLGPQATTTTEPARSQRSRL